LQRVVSSTATAAPALKDLSIIIPALNAGQTVARCLDSLGAGADLILVDGGSIDDTVAIAQRHGAKIELAPKGRGVQLRAGATKADRPWLLFLHADTRLLPGWAEIIDRWIGQPDSPDRFAVFRFQLDDSSWQARMLERLVDARVRLLGLPYGDQGLLIHRDLYARVGGYRPLPLMEDVDLVQRLGRRRMAVLDLSAVTSAQRWRTGGWLRRSARNLTCLALFQFGVSPQRIARFYER
jgi:rSAM/selenodomain-associated transferase 2